MWRLDNRKIYNDWQSWENYLKIKDICVFSVFGGLISVKKNHQLLYWVLQKHKLVRFLIGWHIPIVPKESEYDNTLNTCWYIHKIKTLPIIE